MKTYKIVEYSYPSSPNACRFGFSKVGCFTLLTADETNGHKTQVAFATLTEAKSAGEAYKHPWHPEMNSGWRAA